jgi:hypothetical protein
METIGIHEVWDMSENDYIRYLLRVGVRPYELAELFGRSIWSIGGIISVMKMSNEYVFPGMEKICWEGTRTE